MNIISIFAYLFLGLVGGYIGLFCFAHAIASGWYSAKKTQLIVKKYEAD